MRLLFITSTRIGDAVLSTGLLDHQLRSHPEARVTIACGPVSAPLFEAVPGVEEVLVVRKRPFDLHWLALWSRVATRRWDLIVDLRASMVGLFVPHRRRIAGRRKDQQVHRVVELGELVDLEPPPSPRIWTGPAHEAAADRLIPAAGPVLAVGPAANWPGKQWPAERFAALIARLTSPAGILPGARVAVVAAGHERQQAEPVIESLGSERVIDLVGRVSLPEAAACLTRAALFVGNDSGLMHLAAAAGTPTLGLFGPSRDARYAPWGDHCGIVRTLESDEALRALPDFDRRAAEGSLMDSLTVESVAEAAEALWARGLSSRPAHVAK